MTFRRLPIGDVHDLEPVGEVVAAHEEQAFALPRHLRQIVIADILTGEVVHAHVDHIALRFEDSAAHCNKKTKARSHNLGSVERPTMPTILNHICQKLEKTAVSVVCLSMGNDRDYFVSRAEEEEARAAKCDDASAQDAHLRLAEYYRQAAENRGPQPLSDRQTRPTLTIMSGAAGSRSRPAGH